MTSELKIRPLLPLLFIITLMAAVYFLSYLYPWSWKSLKLFQSALTNFHDSHPVLTPILFMLLYILCAVLSFQGIFLLSLLAGFLFNQPYSTQHLGNSYSGEPVQALRV